ncbi:MAG TPA: tetratricopeptide repeat-containing diguanylate cyclase [Aliidongia sp.]|uniref:tetratricopeptide repeat-containing diguanylate cyclase n=1 Tax=Aliidongia sp. TaxID=1914230 RepID=UPI002DDD60F8|nr:tetratricopeptide repeat-containing diguanylate cyclase [Aliidongia sp.]HEV2674435.1 tetratricopeptide repeat-containing diguanylate cyclase [Aliidongia sp.]
MELYALDDEVSRHEAALPALAGADRLPTLEILAWYLRQRDSARAIALADEASALLHNTPADTRNLRVTARLELVRAEIAVLQCRFDEARARLARADAAFTAIDDPIGLGDSALVVHLLHLSCGIAVGAHQNAEQARDHYSRGHDALRRRIAETWILLMLAYRDVRAAERALDTWDGEASPGPDDGTGSGSYAQEHPAVAAVLLSARAVVHRARNQWAQALLCAARARQRAEAAGLVRHAIAIADNASWYLQELGDLDAAAEWMDREYVAARATGWPSVLAFSITRLGDLLRQLGQLERSREVLQEAIALYDLFPAGTNKGVTHRVLGKTLLALGLPDEALAAFEIAIGIFRTEQYHERLSTALIGAAQTLSLAGRAEEALERIEDARVAATAHGVEAAEIDLCRALAEIHRRHALAPPAGMREPTATVHYLEKALAIGATVDDWQAPVDLLMELSTAWEAAGYTVRGLNYLKQAVAAERREGHRKAANRTLVLQIRHETETARVEALHSEKLVRAETERADALETALMKLSDAQAELERRRAEFERLSLLDPLTGVGNRRHFAERAAAEIARARRDGTRLGVVMIDIDHFKQTNDRFGHGAGDRVLQRVVEIAHAILRPSDFIARLGGDEFVLLIPGAPLEDLHHLAERVREAIADASIEINAPGGMEGLDVTASFGVASLRPGDDAIEPIVVRADAALYGAKREGRNRVVGERSRVEPAACPNGTPASAR